MEHLDSPMAAPPRTVPSLGPRAGSKVLAWYAAEGKFYEAVVLSASPSVATVRYVGYDEIEALPVDQLRPIPPLPDGWAERVDADSGFPYFENAATGTTSWTPVSYTHLTLPTKRIV